MIHQRLYRFSFLVGLTLGLLVGCGKPQTLGPKSETPTPNSQLPTSALKFHWLGKERLATDLSATNFMAIWNLPESARLEAQTLDKLATAPWRLGQTNGAVSNAPTALLRPLLDDLVQAESYLELAGNPNQPGELVFAIRLSAARAALWETNLPQVLHSLSAGGASRKAVASPKTFNLQLSTRNSQLTVSRSGDWTILSARRSTNSAQPATLLESFRSRIAATQTPFPPRATNYLVEAEMDWSRLPAVLGWEPKHLSAAARLNLAVLADGDNLRTTGAVLLADAAPLQLAPWNIPTNLIHDPLIAFSSLRGIGPWAEAWGKMTPLANLKMPAQFFSWAVAGYPLQTYFAIPLAEATNAIRSVAAGVTNQLATLDFQNFPGRLVVETNFSRLTMEGLPFMQPRLEPVNDSTGAFLSGGFIPIMRTNLPMPVELLAQLATTPDLVYYDWEITGPRVEAWLYIGQTLRLAFNRAQLPPDSAGLKWLQALMPRVGNSATALTLNSPGRFSFLRTSTVGLTGLELHLLVDWLEAPNFPEGLHSEQAQLRRSPPLPGKK